MALAPKFAGQKFTALSNPSTLHTLELYLDYVCPYSLKMYTTIYKSVIPIIREKYADKVQILFRQQVQPWHPSSILTHEAGVAVLHLKPESFWDFSMKLFEEARSYYDVNVVNESRNQTYARLAKVAAQVGIDESAFLKLLVVADKPAADGSLNIGNGVTDEMKVLVKMNRLIGVHVTPTVIFDGVVEPKIESSFTTAQWVDYLEKYCV